MNEVKVRIDTAERDLYQIFQAVPTEYISFATLPVGDVEFWIKPQNETESCRIAMWERKDVRDLVSSLSDGRFREQRTRMLLERKNNPELNIAFLIEGDIAFFDNPESEEVTAHELNVCREQIARIEADRSLSDESRIRLKKMYETRARRLNYTRSNWSKQYIGNILQDLGAKYGIQVLYSDSIVDTVRLIGRYEKVYKTEGGVRDLESKAAVINVMQTGRKKGMTPQEFFPCALSLVPGLSREAAIAVGVRWCSFDDLINCGYAYDEEVDASKDEWHNRCLDLLAGLEYGNGKKINKPTSRRVYQYVYGFENVQEPKQTKRKAKRAALATPKKRGKAN